MLRLILGMQSGCSAVGSALRSGRRGRAFESPHPDNAMKRLNLSSHFFIVVSEWYWWRRYVY